MNRYRQIEIVGRGSFGCCWLVERVGVDAGNAEPERFIMKQIDVSRMQPKQKDEATNEVKVLSKLRHPFIINYRESYVQDGLLCIVTDYAERGDLYRAIKSQKQARMLFKETMILRWVAQTTLALKHIHDRKILHRDLKTQNIFLSGPGDGTIKVGDFGISRVLENTQDCAKTAIGTPYYLSPEICQEKPYDYKSDIWSLGCVVFELATLEHAFDSDSMRGLVMKILRGVPPQVPLLFTAELRNLVPDLLIKDPRSRPSAGEVLRRPIIRAAIKLLLLEVERYREGVGLAPPLSPPKGPGAERHSRGSAAPRNDSSRLPGHTRSGSTPSRGVATPARSAARSAARLPPKMEQPADRRCHRLNTRTKQQRPGVAPSSRPSSPCNGDRQPGLVGGRAEVERRDSSDMGIAVQLRNLMEERRLKREQAIPAQLATRPSQCRGLQSAAASAAQQRIREKNKAEIFEPHFEADNDWLLVRETPDDKEDPLDLMATLEEGLRLPDIADDPDTTAAITPSTEPDADVNEGASTLRPMSSPKFLQPDGTTLKLPGCDRDSLTYRIEALKVHLEQELGLDDFLLIYRYLNDESATSAQAAGQPRPLEVQVSSKAIELLPLVHQLIVCEDECYAGAWA